MAKFKEGDRVRLTRKADNIALQPGDIGIVYENGTAFPTVAWGKPTGRNNGLWAVREDDLELAETSTKSSSFKETIMSVQSTIKRLALKATNPNEVEKRDAGLKDDCGNLTEAGKEALWGFVEQAYDTQFVQLAKDINAENKKND